MAADRDDSGQGSDREGPSTILVLNYRGRELLLGSGKFLIGRDPGCQVVVDEPRVSRRHARLDVYQDGGSITDLGSVNGVHVNGARLGAAPRELRNGDVVSIGRQELLVRFRASTDNDARQRRFATTEALLDPAQVAATDLEEEPSRPTEITVGAALIFQVAARVLDAGATREAEDMVGDHLQGVLRDLTRGKPVAAETVAVATSLALRLARRTQKGAWFDFVIDVLCVCRTPCSSQYAGRLADTLGRMDRVDIERLERYGRTLRAGSPSIESIRAAQYVDELVRTAVRVQGRDR